MALRPLAIRLLVVALAIGATALAASASATTPVGKTYVTSNCKGAAYKPRQIVLTCGDAGLVATKLQWSQWGASTAKGSGTGEEKICTPSCAAGSVGRGKMEVTLTQPKLCSQDGKRHFTKIHYVYPNGAPGEGPKQGTIPLPCSLLSNY